MSGKHVTPGLLLLALLTSCSSQKATKERVSAGPQATLGTIAFAGSTGSVHTMDGNQDTGSYVTIANGVVTSVGSGTPPGSAIQIPSGAVIYPGLIDSHSHAISFLLGALVGSDGKSFWQNLANVNVMLQPPCPSSQPCFTPVTSQTQAVRILQGANPNAIGWVLGWNYEPSRLSCNNNQTYGFLCPNNFENANQNTARAQLDQIQSKYPVMVTSESGHIVYVNSLGLSALNICPLTGTQPPGCYAPTINPTNEWNLAQTGQLDEDLAIDAESYIVGLMNTNLQSVGGQKGSQLPLFQTLITAATAKYASLGFTTVQEGAASNEVIEAYISVASQTTLPVRMAFLDYIDLPINAQTTAAYQQQIEDAATLKSTLSKTDMFVAGIKLFADGSNQGYTGYMGSPVNYMNQNPPFTTSAIFSQPYDGLADNTAAAMTSVVQWAHLKQLPVFIHTNGNQAQTNTITALTGNSSSNLRDVIVHFTMPTPKQVQQVAAPKNIGVTFLTNDFYYYYQPLCEQLLGATATANMYPAAWAATAKLNFGLHSDTAVTPPSPLFSMWVATTRTAQVNSWMPPLLSTCQPGLGSQTISRLQAMQAYTTNAAWLYNRDVPHASGGNAIGSLQNGYAGDLVVFAADPLLPSTDLSTVKVLYTVHNGTITYHDPNGQNPIIWPN